LQGIKSGFERGEDAFCVWVKRYTIHMFRNDDVQKRPHVSEMAEYE
jgi:hypothetical protein